MTVDYNLLPGQMQLGNVLMGPGTPFRIDKMDIGNYDVNVQDSQKPMSDEINFGQDTLKPAPVTLTINVMVNKALPNVAALVTDVPMMNFSDDPNLSDLQEVWRAESLMKQWGEQAALLFCGSDGLVRQFYGRPGKFTYQKPKIVNSAYYIVTAEWRRSDTFAYSNVEYFETCNVLETKIVQRIFGNASSWLRFFVFGPANHPIITWGSRQIELDWNIPAGVGVEISSYPWERRVVDSNGLSLAAYIVTDKPYLDTIKFPQKTPTTLAFNASGTNADSKLVLAWQDGWQVMD